MVHVASLNFHFFGCFIQMFRIFIWILQRDMRCRECCICASRVLQVYYLNVASNCPVKTRASLKQTGWAVKKHVFPHVAIERSMCFRSL
jgi:hypothetical protein